MSKVAHLAEIDSLPFVLPPSKISRFLDNINYTLYYLIERGVKS